MVDERERRVMDLIDTNHREIIDLLRELLAFKTITPGDQPVEHDEFIRHQAFLKQTLTNLGFEEIDVWEADAAKLGAEPGSGVNKNRDLRNMPILVGRLPGAGGGRSLILNGHYDVVPLGLLEAWTRDPFAGEIADGKIYGRGTNDMKGGIAAMLKALDFIARAGFTLDGDILAQIVPDEEASCMGTLAACQRGYTADAAIIPEPTNMRVGTAVRGSMGGKLTVFGRAGHAEQPQPHWTEGGAVNAISKAMRVLEGMAEATEEWRTQPDKQHPLVPPDHIIPTVIRGGEWAVTIPEQVEIEFDCMFVPGTNDKRAEIVEKLDAVCANDPWLRENPPELDLGDPEGWIYPAEVGEDEPIVQTALQSLADVGIQPALMGFGSLTDCVHLINYSEIPTINLGPDIESAHSADEFVTVAQLVDLTKTLALAIMRWSGVRERADA
ncbi:MAG: ArgE/DapE family deacylase [Deltaproteobacteria bacterium]|jgi:acetylornithine deacetylase|nr:ArgE/DapE family deacylase [Deltaproteobacteria bacterium]